MDVRSFENKGLDEDCFLDLRELSTAKLIYIATASDGRFMFVQEAAKEILAQRRLDDANQNLRTNAWITALLGGVYGGVIVLIFGKLADYIFGG